MNVAVRELQTLFTWIRSADCRMNNRWIASSNDEQGRRQFLSCRGPVAFTSHHIASRLCSSLGAWHRQASVMSGLSSRTVMAGRFTRTAGNPS
jgi:hypothetical protein